MDELQTADELAARQLDLSLDSAQLYAEYRRLTTEQAALRRLAALVARGVEPSDVFGAVVKEMRQCLRTEAAGLWRYETGGELTLLAADYRSPKPVKWPVGLRIPIDGSTLATMVQRTGQPARMDSYEKVAGSIAARVRAVGFRAAVGVPVIVDGRVWGLATAGSAEPALMPADTEGRISGFAELIGTAVVAGYRDEQKRQMFDDASRRPLLIDALLEGRVFDDCSLCEVASYLRLPSSGPFVVIAAEVRTGGSEPLPLIESKLRSLDVHSAWRLLPDLQIGIAHIPSNREHAALLDILNRVATTLVGISPRFHNLADTAEALRYARAAVNARCSTGRVTVFEDSVLAVAAVSAPEVTQKLADTVLSRFDDLPADERDVLFDTFRAWMDSEGSVAKAAVQLCCHANTVRYRLRRIEERTGRSLSTPQGLTELCLAFEIYWNSW
jgi:PucR C-terminal helix-turn-helix domain/GGDEF-like domain/GAF domain